MAPDKPNILFFQVDNLGFGELSCYSGGPLRGVTTSRIDSFARAGFRMTNYCPESQCTPSRSALLTGRHAIRSGTYSVPVGLASGWGLVAWEKTLGDILSNGGYACAAYGKWHVGEGPGRWPTDKGFEEWYGPPRTYDEALWPTDPWYDPSRDPVSRMIEMVRGERIPTERDQLTLDVRRDCDKEYLRRAEAFIRRNVKSGTPFFVYFNHSLMHMKNKSYSVTAEVEIPKSGAKGVIIAQGGNTNGWSLYAKDGKLKHCYNFLGVNLYFAEGKQPLPAGKHQLRAEFKYDGGGVGKGGTVSLFVDGKKDGEGRIDRTVPMIFSGDETCDLGKEGGSPVSPDYGPSGNEFSGKINWVQIDLEKDDQDHLIAPEERFRIAMARQ